jgi:hypothetical protein
MTIELDPVLLQVRRLEGLPAVRQSGLESLVALTPARYFRRNGAPLVTAVRWEAGRHRGTAIAVAAPAPLLAALVRGGREAGFVVESISPLLAGSSGRLELLPPEERARREGKDLQWLRRWGVAAVVSWSLLGIGTIGHTLFERRRIDARLAELQRPLAAVLASRAESDSAEAMVRQLAADSAEEGATLTTLLQVAAALPDSAFLTQIRIDSAGVGLVAGAARRPPAVLASLERDGGLRAPRFAGRTTPDMIAGRPVERFAIGFGGQDAHP